MSNFLFVSPWCGRIGPNIGLHQMVTAALRRSHRVHIVVPKEDALSDELVAKGATVEASGSLAMTLTTRSPLSIARHIGRSVTQARVIWGVCMKVRPDLLCVNAETLLTIPWIGAVSNVPTISIVHGARFSRLGLIGRGYFAIQQPAVDRYVAVSHTIGNELVTMGVSKRRVEVICNGVNLAEFEPGPSDPTFREDLGIPPGAFVLGTVCHLTPRKGVHHLVGILQRAVPHLPNLICLVVGAARGEDRAYYADLLASIAAARLERHIRLLGDRQDVARILKEIDVLVHPSETESFGRVIAEAMSCEKPVIAFSVDAVPELVADQVTGFLVPPFNAEIASQAIVRLHGDINLRHRLGRAGRAKACQEYDHRATIARTLDLLEKVSVNGRGFHRD